MRWFCSFIKSTHSQLVHSTSLLISPVNPSTVIEQFTWFIYYLSLVLNLPSSIHGIYDLFLKLVHYKKQQQSIKILVLDSWFIYYWTSSQTFICTFLNEFDYICFQILQDIFQTYNNKWKFAFKCVFFDTCLLYLIWIHLFSLVPMQFSWIEESFNFHGYFYLVVLPNKLACTKLVLSWTNKFLVHLYDLWNPQKNLVSNVNT